MEWVGCIRDDLAELHDQIERTPFAKAMGGGALDRATYAFGLAQLARIHEALESRLRDRFAGHPCYDPDSMDRAAVARRDLARLAPEAGEAAPTDETKRLMGRIRHFDETNPPALFGVLYVLEGSRMGSMFLGRELAKAFQLPAEEGVGLDYHLQDVKGRPAAWKGFKQTLDESFHDEADRRAIRGAAVDFMAGLLELYAKLPVASPEREETTSAKADSP